MRKMVTIKDIAKNTGVSISTVSRVINGNTKVNEEIREKVLKEIKKTGYKPNSLAQNLVLKKNNLIGVILSKITNPYFAELLSKIEENLYKNGYDVLFMNSNEEREKEKKCIQNVLSKNVAGIIISPAFEEEKYMQKLFNTKIPVVSITKTVKELNSVAISHEVGAELVAKHFISLGHEKIAYLSDTKLHEKFDGFYNELKKMNIKFDKNKDFLDIGMNEKLTLSEKVELCLRKKIADGEFDYTAIYASNDVIAFECMNFFREQGYNVPEDIAICGFDGTDFARISNISTVSQPISEIVDIACNILLKEIKSEIEVKNKENIEIVPRLISRGSTLKIIRK